MFIKQLDYFTKYHNTYIKHDDSVIDAEIEIIFEFTCSFMKFLLELIKTANKPINPTAYSHSAVFKFLI
jgi:hypothetical protein